MGIFSRRASAFFRKSKADAFLVFSGGGVQPLDANFLYFTEAEIDGCALLARRGEQPILFASEMNCDYARELLGADFEIAAFKKKSLLRKLSENLKGVRSLALDFDGISAAKFLQLKRRLRKRLANASGAFLETRAVKSEGEIAKIKKATAIAKSILANASISRAKTERQLAGELLAATLERGCQPSFPPIVASGKNSAFPHATPTNRKLGGCVLIDFGVKYKNYCSDLTRCFFLGRCDEERGAYAKLQKVHGAVAKAASKTKSASALVASANSMLEKLGLPKLPHGLGHGVGLDVHEKPSLRKNSKDRLADGNVFTIEPGAYFPGKFGVRYENMLVYRNGKANII